MSGKVRTSGRRHLLWKSVRWETPSPREFPSPLFNSLECLRTSMSEDPLFPLPLVPFEYYMVTDERPGYPMTIPMRVDVRGTIDRDALHAALDETVNSHPLLKSVLQKVRGKGLSWQLVDDWQTPIEWNSGPSTLELDIRKQPGLRVWIRELDDGAEITILFHHACCDGIAVFHFFGDLLAAYARRTALDGQSVPREKPTKPELLTQRGVFPVELPEPVGLWTIIRETLRESYRWLTRPATPLAIPALDGAEDRAAPTTGDLGFVWAAISADEVQRYRELATSCGVTLNDMLIRDMFLAVDTWNEKFAKGRPGRWLRVTMPTSVRQRCHRNMPVANGISYAFLTRTRDDCQDPATLLQGIRDETKFIRDWHVSLMFLNAIAIARRIPFFVSLMLRNTRRCYSTTNLSYLGDFPRLFRVRLPRTNGKIMAGNLIVERLVGAPPVRPQTHVTLAIVGYCGELFSVHAR